MVLDKVLGDGQAEAAAPFPPGNQRVEHAFANGLGNPRTVVDHLDHHGQTIKLLGQGHLPDGARVEDDFATALHRLGSVAGNIENGLDQLLAIPHQFRQTGIVVAAHAEGAGVFGGQQAAHPFQDFVDIDRCRLHRTVRGEQTLHQVLQTICLLDDVLGVFIERRVVQFVFQQLGGPPNSPQRILDLVRQIPDQFPISLLLLDQAFFAAGRQLLFDGLQFEEQTGIFRNISRQGGDRAIEVQLVAVGPNNGQILPGIAPVVIDCVIESGLQGQRAGKGLAQWLAGEITTAAGEKIFRRRVEVTHSQPVIQQQDRRSEEVQASKGSGNLFLSRHPPIVAMDGGISMRPASRTDGANDHGTCVNDPSFIIIATLFSGALLMPTLRNNLIFHAGPVALVLSASLLLTACGQQENISPPPRSVLVQAAAPGGAAATVYTGEVRARHEIDLAFRVGGKIISRHVDTGALVKPGQALAKLDPADLQLALQAARAQLSSAESEYLTSKAEAARYADLAGKKFVSQAACDAKENAFRSAQGKLEQARAQAATSGNQAAYGTLASEQGGVITAVLVEAGQVVSPGQPVMRLARPEEKEIAISIPEGRIAEIRAASQIAVNLWADADKLIKGELRELAPAADAATRTYAARIRLLDPPASVQLGMTARVLLGGVPSDAPIVVPLTAVVDQGQGPAVWVAVDNKAQRRPVEVRQFREDGAVIASGLKTGELVIVAGTNKLVVDLPITPKPLTPPAKQR